MNSFGLRGKMMSLTDDDDGKAPFRMHAQVAGNSSHPDYHPMSRFDFDAIILGGGSAGYAAARSLTKGGWKVAVVDGSDPLGGLCILRGCMPTKALLHAAELRQAFRQGEAWGITAQSVDLDPARLFDHKDAIISEFARYRREQLENGPFELIRSHARFTDPQSIQLDDQRTLRARYFVIATGSELAPPPFPFLSAAGYLTSDTALRLDRIPESLIVLGGGAVALEFAQFFSRMGSLVSVIQRSPRLLRSLDPDLSDELETALDREGIQIFTDTQIRDIRRVDGEKEIVFDEAGREVTLAAEEIFNGLGRRPATRHLALEKAGVELRPSGHILTDDHQRTSAPHIFAAGDCCGPHELVHVAILQAEAAARTLLNPSEPGTVDPRLLTQVVFTDPGVAVTGIGEREAAAQGTAIRVARYPFNDHGKSIILGCQEGFVKLITAAHSGEILGGACVGPLAGELIHEVTVAIAARLTAERFAAIPHYHPTLAEIWTYPAEELAQPVVD
jgi:pyruvate/2-oxoglutarate dehydrogenase complex dihydrolipoamide dehydrogenase (E3) component